MSSHDLSEEPPDAAWLEEEALRRRQLFEAQRAASRASRLHSRERESLSSRLQHVERAILLATTVSAANISGEGGGAGMPTSRIPPHADKLALGGEDPKTVVRLLRLVREAVERLEGIVDSHYGVGNSRKPLDSVDLDKLLVSYEGLTPEEVSKLEPLLGSPAAVRKSRALLKRHREDGSRIRSS